jgi:hypothetical protein
MPSSPPPDRFQREIDDIIRLAERRLEHQSFGYRVKRWPQRIRDALGRFSFRLPPPETLGGWGLALLLISWLLTLPIVNGLFVARLVQPWVLILGVLLLTLALVSSLLRGKGGGSGDDRMWRGERVSYGSPYGDGLLNRLRRMFRGR